MSEISRRTLLGSGAALAAAGLVAVPAQARVRRTDMLYGVNEESFEAMLSVIPQTGTCRAYLPIDKGVPFSWPGKNLPAGFRTLILSFHPDPNSLLSGALDAPLAQFMSGAPTDGSAYLVAWHEANLLSSNFQQVFGGTAQTFVSMQAYLKNLAQQANPGLNIGQILGTYQTSGSKVPWTCPGLDLYGLDGYGRSDTSTPTDHFFSSIVDIRSVYPAAPLAITETNASRPPNQQNKWFRQAFSLAQNNNMIAWLTFWGPKVGSFDSTGPNVSTLQEIAIEAAG